MSRPTIKTAIAVELRPFADVPGIAHDIRGVAYETANLTPQAVDELARRWLAEFYKNADRPNPWQCVRDVQEKHDDEQPAQGPYALLNDGGHYWTPPLKPLSADVADARTFPSYKEAKLFCEKAGLYEYRIVRVDGEE